MFSKIFQSAHKLLCFHRAAHHIPVVISERFSVFPLGGTDVLSSWRLSHLVVYLVFIHAVARSHEVIPSALYSIRNWFTYSWNRRWYHAFITRRGNKHPATKYVYNQKKKRIKLITRNGLLKFPLDFRYKVIGLSTSFPLIIKRWFVMLRIPVGFYKTHKEIFLHVDCNCTPWQSC